MKSPSLRLLPLIPLIAALSAGLRADEVQKLPDMQVARPAAKDVQVTLADLPAGPDASAGLDDVARRTAGFTVSDAGARGFGLISTLRGLGNTPFFGESSAPVYLDDIPLASAATFPTGLFDFSSVAVHRGPQTNTLFGRAADAGVIQFTSARPQGGTQSRASVTAGDHGLFGASATFLSAPTADTDVTAGFGYSQRDGYIRNTTLNQTVDDRESLSARVKFTHRPAAGTELSLHVLGSRSRDGAQALVPLGGPLFEVQRGQEGRADTDFAAAAFGLSRELGHGTLSSTTSYSKWDLSPYSNRLVVFGGLDFDSVMTQTQRTFAEELRFVAANWSAGAFWSTSRTRGATDRVFSGWPIEKSSFTTDGDTLALFGRGSYAMADGWTLTPGLRAERAEKDFERIETIPGSTTIRRSEDWSALLPSLAATRQLDEATDLTFSLARGFKAGGFSAFTGRADLTAFGPQRAWTAEAAFRTKVTESNLAYTARAYASRVSGYQIERSFAVPNSFTDEYLVVNADEARVLGFELESVWTPAADWTVTLAASVSRAELRDFTDPFTGTSYSGNQAPYAPTGNGALRVDYRPQTGFFAGAGVTWTGTTYYDEQETAMFAQRSYTLIEADAGYAFTQGTVRVFGRNLGDEKYYSAITPGVGHATPGAPITWGVELNVGW
ncbi:MAG: iron complex outerrane recepter protein [Verrucomicrobiota bacterium]|nr:iron complex outerrane recepter protein [Verrucomicrobiota bacterium]